MDVKPGIFEFTSYAFDPKNRRVSFTYTQKFSNRKSLVFVETIILPKTVSLAKISEETLHTMLESLHLVLGLSYYKFYCATNVSHRYDITKEQADFWNT